MKAKSAPKRGTENVVLSTILAELDDAKAENIVTIDLDGKAAIADGMVIASGRSNRQVVAIFEKWGFTWGGTWHYTDPMHFELNRIVHPG